MALKSDGIDTFKRVGVAPSMSSSRLIGVCAILCLFIALLYFNSLGNQFTNWDDGMIYQNPSIRSLDWNGIKNIFTLQKGSTYQPVRMLSYAIDYHFWKLNPAGYHLTNIFFYILTCIMVYLTLFLLSEGLRERATPESHERVAMIGALLFAAHPVHVEAVTWLAARKEVLQGFFFFLAFYSYLKFKNQIDSSKNALLLLTLFSFLFAVLSKPSAVIFPGIIILYEIVERKGNLFISIKKNWIFTLIAFMVSAIFIFILLKVMSEAGGIKPFRGHDLASNILVWIYALLQNIKLTFLTMNYSAAYSNIIGMPIFIFKNIILSLLTASLFVVSILSFRKTKILFFSFFFFLITVLPYLNIIPISTLKADRYVFIASFSYVFLLGIAFDRLYTFQDKRLSPGFFKLLSVVLFILLIAGYSFMTIYQNSLWKNSYTLWTDAVEKHPKSNLANAMMGVVYMDLEKDQEAAKYLENAVQLLPADYYSLNNLGIVYRKLNEPEKALKALRTAILLNSEDKTIKINLALLYQKTREYHKAEEIFQEILRREPVNAELQFRLGMMYKEAGQYDEAVSALQRAMKLAPHIINPYEELGNLYASQFKDKDKAIHYYSLGIEAAPDAKTRVEDLKRMIQDLETAR